MSSNSSITADEFVPGRTLRVNLAENGSTFEVECDGSTPVEAIQRTIESQYGVQMADQLLMCGKFFLDRPHQALAYYKLPQDGREVFVINKATLHGDPPPKEVINVPKATVPSSNSPVHDPPHPFRNVADPALNALASYETRFRYHYNHADAYYSCAAAKLEICNRMLREYQVQERVLETFRGSLESRFRILHQRYSEFVRHFTQQHRSHAELLMNFDRDVERLQSLRLHPAVQSEGRKCLLDLVKVDGLRKCAEECLTSHGQFEEKVSKLKADFRELKESVEGNTGVLPVMNSAGSKELEVFMKNHQRILSEHKIVMQSLSKDVSTVKKLVDDCVSCQLSSSLRPHDALSALGPMYDVHEKNHIPKVENCDKLMTNLLNKCKGKKDDMNLLVHVCMKKVKVALVEITNQMNRLHGLEEIRERQDTAFENLKFVNGVGHAYRACLAEVIRRRSSLKLYMGLAGQLAERLATEREAEIRRREGFHKAWSKYIPHDILVAMGLFDSPSQCDVNMAPFDTKLLEIDVADVDRYAPQALVGLPLKTDKNRSPKNKLATSSESCNFNKSDEGALDTNVKYDFDGFLEDCESVDIAGTSKIEVENAQLKAELASAIALICTFNAGIGFDPFDMGEPDEMLKIMKEKTAEALQLKDEYVKHLQSMLNMKQEQCSSYEKRIQELEHRLEDQYAHGQKISANDSSESVLSAFKSGNYREGMFGDGETNMPCISALSMDETSSTSALDPQHDLLTGQMSKPGGGDESMTDLSGTVNMQSTDSARNFMDASMQETLRDGQQVGDSDNLQVGDADKNLHEDANREVKMTVANNSRSSTRDAPEILPSGVEAELDLESKTRECLVLDLQNALANKSTQFIDTENQLKAAMEEIRFLRRELEVNQILLDESQLNCAHLENRLHEAREEAQTNLCAADGMTSKYNSLRTTAVRMRGLFERFRSCVTSQVGLANFADALHSLALSLSSSVCEDEDEVTGEFRSSIKVLSDKVSLLSRHRSELLERCSRAEAALQEKTEQLKTLYTKHQLEKQASKEKISFVRLEVHELACFVQNSAGHYAAIHRNCTNYYLSAESVALFTEQYSGRPPYIIGQIVHIERRITRQPPSPSPRTDTDTKVDSMNSGGGCSNRLSPVSGDMTNPYGLPAGCEYFIVTVAMLPDTIRSSPSGSPTVIG